MSTKNSYNYEMHRKPKTIYNEYGDYVVHRNNEIFKLPEISRQYQPPQQFNGNNYRSVSQTIPDMYRELVQNKNLYSEKPNNIIQNNASALLNNNYNDRYQNNNNNFQEISNRANNKDQQNYESQKQQFYIPGSQSAVYSSSPKNNYLVNGQLDSVDSIKDQIQQEYKFKTSIQQEKEEQFRSSQRNMFRINKAIQKSNFNDDNNNNYQLGDIQQANQQSSKQMIQNLRQKNYSQPNGLGKKLLDIKNQYKHYEVSDKVTEQQPQNSYNLYNSDSYRIPTYKNYNIRSVANICMKDRNYPEQIDYGHRRKHIGVDNIEQPILDQNTGKIRFSKLGDVFNQITTRSPEKSKQQKLEILERDARQYAIAENQELDIMKNISHKLNIFKDKLRSINDPQKAKKYKEAIEKRIQSQMTNKRKVKLTQQIISELQQQK